MIVTKYGIFLNKENFITYCKLLKISEKEKNEILNNLEKNETKQKIKYKFNKLR